MVIADHERTFGSLTIFVLCVSVCPCKCDFRILQKMIGGAGGVTEDRNTDLDGARVGPPPDLPSLLLHNRIVYLGMPLVPAVTELIIAEVRLCMLG